MQVLQWLANRYSEVERNLSIDFKDIREECHDLEQADTIPGGCLFTFLYITP